MLKKEQQCQKENANMKQKKNRKGGLLVLLLFGLVLLTGTVVALFSDSLNKEEQFGTGNFAIDGTYTYYINGQEMQPENIKYLLPGDIITIKVDIENVGNYDAWIRDIISFNISDHNLLNFFEVYGNDYSREEIMSGDLEAEKMTFVDNTIISNNKVFTSSETELAVEELDHEFHETNYLVYYTIYFRLDATNEAQNKSFNIMIETQALQYANNTVSPNNDVWQVVSRASL